MKALEMFKELQCTDEMIKELLLPPLKELLLPPLLELQRISLLIKLLSSSSSSSSGCTGSVRGFSPSEVMIFHAIMIFIPITDH